jgi:hypothetical protein
VVGMEVSLRIPPLPMRAEDPELAPSQEIRPCALVATGETLPFRQGAE